jgi:Glycerol-3-phosphate acyltransferase C-terminal region
MMPSLTRYYSLCPAIVCVSLYTVIKRGGAKLQQRMQFDELLDEVSFVSSILKLDMIFKQGGVESNTLRTVRWLVENDVLEVTDDGWVGLTDAERACGRENFGKSMLRAFFPLVNAVSSLRCLYRFLMLSHLAIC